MSGLDPAWDRIYDRGEQLNRYPFDVVVNFVFRQRPRAKPIGETRVLEVGFGAGNNLAFCAREGFQVAGIEGSRPALDAARTRFDGEGLAADLRGGGFAPLPWDDAVFDLAIDRAALTCVGYGAAAEAIAELHRVLAPEGKLLFTPYSKRHASASLGTREADGTLSAIRGGSLLGVGRICFYDLEDIVRVFAGRFVLLSAKEVTFEEHGPAPEGNQAEWRVIAEKI